MTVMLTEFYLKEAKINQLGLPNDSAVLIFEYFKEKYASEVGKPDSVFQLSYQYYVDHPIELNKIYDRVIDSLTLSEQRWQARGVE